MASMDSVHQKFFRVKCHFEELNRELKAYYENVPGRFVVDQADPTFGVFEQTKPVPARIGLIAGDCLQAMRSALDYLVWELVLVAGLRQPDRQNAFPVALTEDGFESEVTKRHRLKGVPDEAIALIEASQPFHEEPSRRDGHMLAVLDNLVNVNKHKRVLLTSLGAVYGPMEKLPLSYLESHVAIHHSSGEVFGGRFISFVTLKEAGVIGGWRSLDSLMRSLITSAGKFSRNSRSSSYRFPPLSNSAPFAFGSMAGCRHTLIPIEFPGTSARV